MKNVPSVSDNVPNVSIVMKVYIDEVNLMANHKNELDIEFRYFCQEYLKLPEDQIIKRLEKLGLNN
jgi:hypothetical protein